MKKFPRLETKRLTLRAFEMSDVDSVVAMAGDWLVAQTLTLPYPYCEADAVAWIKASAPFFEKGEIVNFAVCLKENGQLIGSLGLKDILAGHRAEMGYWIGKAHWNHGYATEAGLAVMTYGFEVLKLRRIFAHHLTWNPASGRVMSKMGMSHEGVLREHIAGRDGAFEDMSVYGILREEWKKKHSD